MMHRTFPSLRAQRGAALLIMVAIMVVGIAAILVGSLNSSAINISRQEKTAAALAQAKEALIGRAAADPSLPGSLPCPDQVTNTTTPIPNIPNDGVSDSLAGNDCPSYIGRLPWKTLGLTDLRDGQGERLWYALSPNFRDDNSNHINSDAVGTLDITGAQSTNNAVAIIFSAGTPLSGNSRSNTKTTVCSSLIGTTLAGVAVPESWCAQNYLDGNNAKASTAAAPNTNYQAGTSTGTLINDQLLIITQEHLLPLIEMRIAREVKSCLDSYATPVKKYPWAVPPSSTYYTGETGTKFGRIPYQPAITDNKISDFIDALDQLQAKVNACIANDSNTNAYGLDIAGGILEHAAQALNYAQPTTPAIPTSATYPGKTAGDRAQYSNMCDTIHGNPISNTVQTNLNSANNALASVLSGLVATSNSSKSVSCPTLFSQGYWQNWKDMVFYQIDDLYKPTGTASGSGSLSINGTGSYRAVVLVGRKIFPPKTLPRNHAIPSDFLESPNAHTSSNPINTFESYRPSESLYQTRSNDLVLCLDGLGNCK